MTHSHLSMQSREHGGLRVFKKLATTDNTERRHFLIDGMHPEDVAMLQALYSRSASSVEKHLEKVLATGSGKFMESYYVRYNHKSIGDGGSTTLFLENVSMLCAKGIEDWALFSGQETSTRFIDMSLQPIANPVGTDNAGEIQNEWMAFYSTHQGRVAAEVRRRHAKNPNETDKDYEAAVKTRTFDILRGFLPAGLCTNVSWHTNLRQASDHLALLRHHPSPELRAAAGDLTTLLAEAYPSSIGVNATADVSSVKGGEAEREEWRAKVAADYSYPVEHPVERNLSNGQEWSFDATKIDRYRMNHHYDELLSSRPRGAVLPHFLSDLGQIHLEFLLDFGSFRDVQRHRNGVCRMPVLTLRHGMHPWYLEQLDEELAKDARALIAHLSERIMRIEDPVLRQYYIPMGMCVACQVTYGLPSAVYVTELRSAKTVHPTLRKIAHWLHGNIKKTFPQIALHSDMDPDDWSLRRGQQTITEKGA
jgi:thymidylate synthase ThyX